jgi:NADH:ubiquinone oxidoreductase subunit 6 (subunit J)
VNLLFYIFAITTCAGAVAVVLSQNVVRMAFWLVISLGSVAGLYFLASADFIGAAQLLIYVGGTLILLVFGVMLTASGPYLKISASTAEVAMAAGIGCLFLFVLVSTVLSVDWSENESRIATVNGRATSVAEGYNDPASGNTTRPLGLSLLGLRPDRDLGRSDGGMSAGYLLPFEIASVHLLVVLIGAAYLARAKRRVDTEEAK